MPLRNATLPKPLAAIALFPSILPPWIVIKMFHRFRNSITGYISATVNLRDNLCEYDYSRKTLITPNRKIGYPIYLSASVWF